MGNNKKMKKKKKNTSESDEDDTFYYRYASVSTSAPPPPSSTSSNPNPNPRPKGSGGLAPSKSTLYVSNLDYSLTNSDLHTLFSTFGKVARVTILKDRASRLSRGVAFVQFVAAGDALSAAGAMHGKVLNGRTISASIAADNGRAPEFIKKRVYRDKTRCYECGGEDGHLSYECPRNQLGPRERPAPKRLRRGEQRHVGGGDEGDRVEDGFDENWASVVDGGADERLLMGGGDEEGSAGDEKRAKKASYFSDESGDED